MESENDDDHNDLLTLFLSFNFHTTGLNSRRSQDMLLGTACVTSTPETILDTRRTNTTMELQRENITSCYPTDESRQCDIGQMTMDSMLMLVMIRLVVEVIEFSLGSNWFCGTFVFIL